MSDTALIDAAIALAEHLLLPYERRRLGPLEKRLKRAIRAALKLHQFDIHTRQVYWEVTHLAFKLGAAKAFVQLSKNPGQLREAKKPPPVIHLPDPERTAAIAASQIDWEDLDASSERALMIAEYEISKAFHDGARAVARIAASSTWRGGNGPVEKIWNAQPDTCPICAGNADEEWIDEEAPFGSGDFIPPQHPNCRCSISYRTT